MNINIPITRPAVIATVGLPGSGKTTWADKQVREDETGHLTIVNRDHIRAMLRRPFDKDEDLVTDVQRAAIRACLVAGKSVIVDDTNLNPGMLNDLQAWSMRQVGEFITVTHFLFISPETCAERDRCRPVEQQVGGSVITALYERWRGHWPQMDGWESLPSLKVHGDPCAG